jgi:hypothetical protein
MGLSGAAARSERIPEKPFSTWTLAEAVGVLNGSPWARRETYTRVVGGIGSGVSGEKEIYSTFFIRFLSAGPIREAYARVHQIQANYDQLGEEERRRIDRTLEPGLRLDVSRWIVVALSFRSNDARLERRIKQFLEVQTSESMKSRAYLAAARFPQVEIAAYYPPIEDVVGAKFVFPRTIDGAPVVSALDPAVAFELEVPGFEPELRVSFPVSEMLVEGIPVL